MALPRRKHNIFDTGSISEAMKAAAKASEEHAKRNKSGRKRPEKNKGLVERIQRKLYELYHGKNAYLPKKK